MSEACTLGGERLKTTMPSHACRKAAAPVGIVRGLLCAGFLRVLCGSLMTISLMIITASPVRADTSVVNTVRAGIRQFFGGDYEAAEQHFATASTAAPENLTVVYDHACALAATGDSDRAKELFLKSAMSRDLNIAADSHYNLGCLVSEQGRAALGSDPVEATADQRERGVALLLAAVAHYRDCLKLKPEHQNARHNLELIRLFLKHIQSQWDERDRQQRIDSQSLLQLLRSIEDRQQHLRSQSQPDEPPAAKGSVHQRARVAAEKQRMLAEEIEPLKDKIDQEFQNAALQPSSTTSNSSPNIVDPAATAHDSQAADQQAAQQQAARQLLLQLADESGQLMSRSADALAVSDFSGAHSVQGEALDRLNQIYMVVAPFPDLLQRAIEQQTELLPEGSAKDDDPVWRQSRITDWSHMLQLKAQHELPLIESQLPPPEASTIHSDNAAPAETTAPDAAATPVDTGESDSAAEPDDVVRPEDVRPSVSDQANTSDDQVPLSQQPQTERSQTDQPSPEPREADQQAAELQAVAQAMRTAIELTPQIIRHSQSATEFLRQSSLTAAEPEQREALRLLQEIAEQLPEQPPESDSSQDSEPSSNDQKQDDQKQDEQDQSRQDQSQHDQSQQDSQNQSSNEQQEPPGSQSQEGSSEESQAGSEQQMEQEAAEQRALSILRRAREREQQHRDLQKQIREIIGGRAPVDKDW